MRLRLVKVVVQPVLMADDGDTLTEMVPEPITVSAKDWPTYPTEGFAQACAELERQMVERQMVERHNGNRDTEPQESP